MPSDRPLKPAEKAGRTRAVWAEVANARDQLTIIEANLRLVQQSLDKIEQLTGSGTRPTRRRSKAATL